MADHWKVSGLVPDCLRPSGTTGTHGRPLEGVRACSWLSQTIRRNRNTWQTIGRYQGLFLTVSDHQTQQEHMADPWRVSGLVPGCPQTIRNTWQILGRCQGWFLAVLRPSGTHGRSLEGVRVGSWQSSDHQGHMADPWRVSGLVPGSSQAIRNTWQILGGCQGLFLAVLRPSGTHGRSLEGVRACSWQSSGHQAQQEHMADPWRVSGLVPVCPRIIRRNRNTWQIKMLHPYC